MFFQLLVERESLTELFGCPSSIVASTDATAMPRSAKSVLWLMLRCVCPRVAFLLLCYEDTDLSGLVDGDDDAQGLCGLRMPYCCCNFKKSRSQMNLTVWRTGGVPATQNSSSVVFVLSLTLPFRASNGTQSLALPT